VKDLDKTSLLKKFQQIRKYSEKLCESLEVEDYVIQAIPEVSPPKWHLAHTTWFFESFILRQYLPDYQEFDANFSYLFNSYYQQVGEMHARPLRGQLSRPTVKEVYAYRAYVNENIGNLLELLNESNLNAVLELVEIGLHHEQQHQELLVMDVKYNFWVNPIRPAYLAAESDLADMLKMKFDLPNLGIDWLGNQGGMAKIGVPSTDFAYDNESPRHTVFLQPHALANRLVTNGEYLEFIEDKGYTKPEYWLSDGWDWASSGNKCPLYWEKQPSNWNFFTLHGMQKLDMNAPVCHISFYEADAYARWKGMRLPTEFEWEVFAQDPKNECLYGQLWEWTQSAYLPYPGFRPVQGALGEYNGKFMNNQLVLRGGSCITPKNHMRPTYRNFFHPHDRWQFAGLRLAKDIK
jgi:ergothioneine biosynthesis protein EgtB